LQNLIQNNLSLQILSGNHHSTFLTVLENKHSDYYLLDGFDIQHLIVWILAYFIKYSLTENLYCFHCTLLEAHLLFADRLAHVSSVHF